MNGTRRNTVDFAIDLGTSDSVIACFNGKESRIIKNHFTGEDHTPSAVYIDDSGEVHIGKEAKDAVISNPFNAVSEFKLNMGFPIPFYFESANRRMFPEQLSSELLKDLKRSIYADSGKNIEEIVVTVPANSNPLKTKACKEAAELAGFKKVYLILEPVAAAIAYGLRAKRGSKEIWMIYDLGGGTFDVSLVNSNGREIEKLATSGEDNLGGKLFDWKIVDDHFTPKIRDDLNLNDFTRDNPKYLKAFALLKNEAEKAKIALSSSNEDISDYELSIDKLFGSDFNGDAHLNSYCFSYKLTKEDLKEVMKPFLKTTFNHCYDVLDEKKISIEDVEKIILVGGSTLSPIIRENIESEFNRPLEYGINPLTVVAQGASIYAGTIEKEFIEPKDHKFALILDYEKIGPKNNIGISGKVFSLDGKFSFLGYSIEAVNVKDNEVVMKQDLDIDGNFKLDILAFEDYNEFLINVYDEKGNLMEIDENSANSISYRKAINPGYNILPSSISLYLDEDSSLVLMEDSDVLINPDFKKKYMRDYTRRFNSTYILAGKGARIPKDKKDLFCTTDSIEKGDEDSFIKFSFYSGELMLGNYNTPLGEIAINGNDIMDDLPKGSLIELNMHIDESNIIGFEVFIPYLRQSFKNSFISNDYRDYNAFLDNYDNLKAKSDETIEKYDILRDFAQDEEKIRVLKKRTMTHYVHWVCDIIEGIEEKEIINYLNILIDMAKYDRIAVYPSLEYLNYLDDVLDECRFYLDAADVDIGI